MLKYPGMLRFLDRLDALSLNLIWNFETTSKLNPIEERGMFWWQKGVVETSEA
jgi:hypothetical protein